MAFTVFVSPAKKMRALLDGVVLREIVDLEHDVARRGRLALRDLRRRRVPVDLVDADAARGMEIAARTGIIGIS